MPWKLKIFLQLLVFLKVKLERAKQEYSRTLEFSDARRRIKISIPSLKKK